MATNTDTPEVRLEGDNHDPQATFWTKATHLPTGVVYEDRAGFIRKRQLLDKLREAVAAHYANGGR